ncbi:MFS transporter [Agrobacterium sp. Ap1]|uniref:MFS transporter n=1 Tax=Agrobacterium sp. Ap1 TaxID=2815337 RepID=UPI001A8E5411|nr:MFS transporter [Agrobacterium sp. Ap1]MBO0144642.1 MFS transporter [Agrobacterium sp. Ap1]
MTSTSAQAVTTRQVYLFAFAAAVMVANIYYSQPLLAVIAQSFGVDPAHAGYLVTLTQLGYGLGVLFIVPLGDGMDRRKLASFMLAGCVVMLIATALSPTFLFFAAAQLLMGATACATMVLIPYVASGSPEDVRGQRVGLVITGVLLGILLARTVSGVVAEFVGWRWMYVFAAVAVSIFWFILRQTMVADGKHKPLDYLGLLKSVASMIRDEPEVRRRSVYCMLGMGSFSALWTGLTLHLTSDPFNYSPATVGLFGLVGAAGALSASYAGRLADRGWTSALTGGLAVMLAASWLLMAIGGHYVPVLIAGILVLDVAAMGLQVVHQSVLYKLNTTAQSRITSIFVTAAFIGMSIGSGLGSLAFSYAGWLGLCVVGGAMPALLVLHWAVMQVR